MVSHLKMGGIAKSIKLPDDLEIISEHFFISVDGKDRAFKNGNIPFDFNIESFKTIYKNILSITI